MKQTTLTELCNHAKQYFDLVAQGESMRVLSNGKPIADIVPGVPYLPSWKRRQVQPLLLYRVALSRLVLDERGSGL